MRPYQRLPSTTSNQPAVDRKCGNSCKDQRQNKASPEKRFGKPGVHSARYEEHDSVVDNSYIFISWHFIIAPAYVWIHWACESADVHKFISYSFIIEKL